jgi:transcriptional regulator with PAS, ATPase and Fis domain
MNESKIMEKNWADNLPFAVTVCDTNGTILYMNPASVITFNKDGGAALIGTNVLDCHPEPSKTRLMEMLKDQSGQTYTTEKNGRKTLIHQVPWYEDGEYKGLIELSIKLPEKLRNIVR